MAVLGIALLCLLAGFGISLDAASRRFEHALIAQRQADLVVDIARDANTRRADALAQGLADYRDLVRDETRWLTPAERVAQQAEVQRAVALAQMAPIAARREEVAATVRQIAQDETREVAAARVGLDSVRRQMIALAALLALVALCAASFGVRQLIGANRVLTHELSQRRAAIEAIDASRRLFLAKAGHELRTPVTAIRTLAEVALQHPGADSAPDRLRDIVAQTGFLDHRIEDLLALALAGEAAPQLDRISGNLADVVDAAVAQAQAYATAIGVVLEWRAPATIVPCVFDPRWLGQAVLTVIDNGLKFSDPGAALVIDCRADGDCAVITVADTGPGVLPRDLPRIFDAYYQAEAGRSRGGTGLGLALARWVVERHGGTIHAENRDGGGCRIVFLLPLGEAR